MANLAKKTVVVVGGSSGIGHGVARAAAERGADVVLVGRHRERLDSAAQALGITPEPRSLVADVTRETDVAALFESVGAVDHLVVTAADLRYEPVASVSLEAIRAVLDSKLVAAVLLAKHAVKRMRPGGSILFTSGVASERPAPKGALVAAVNGALDALARALAIELAPLRVNTLSPGWVDTELWQRVAPVIAGVSKEEVFARMAPRLPARRVGRPEELGQAAVFLMENEFTTGTTLFVDGGHRLA